MKCVFSSSMRWKRCVCASLYIRTHIYVYTHTNYNPIYPTGVYMYTWRMEPEWAYTNLHAYNYNFSIMRKITLSSTHTLYYIIYLQYLYIVQGIYIRVALFSCVTIIILQLNSIPQTYTYVRKCTCHSVHLYIQY